jgi:arylsulfatase A-like enzyme
MSRLREQLPGGMWIAVLVAVVVSAALWFYPRAIPRLPAAVVLITIDTLRADFVFGGPHQPETPFFDRLAQHGTVFTAAYAPSSWTVPSMASLFTSLAPLSHGVIHGRIDPLADAAAGGDSHAITGQPVLPASLVTLAERLQAAGYRTVGVPSNLHLRAALGFAQGFDHYHAAAEFADAPRVNAHVREQLESAFGSDWKLAWKRQPTFLWVHYFDPHDPYDAHEPWMSRYAPDFAADPSSFPTGRVMRDLVRAYPNPGTEIAARIAALYQSEISFLDDHVRRLDEEIGLSSDNVLLIVTADHGEGMAEHGRLGHGNSLYEELVHIPLLVHWPAQLRTGQRMNVPVSLLDVYPTILDLLGLTPPSGLQGTSVVPLLRGELTQAAPPLVFHLDRVKEACTAVRDGDWKLIHSDRPEESVQLFDLRRDPGELHDVAASYPAEVERLASTLHATLQALPKPPSDGNAAVVPDENVREQLRALGYAE